MIIFNTHTNITCGPRINKFPLPIHILLDMEKIYSGALIDNKDYYSIIDKPTPPLPPSLNSFKKEKEKKKRER